MKNLQKTLAAFSLAAAAGVCLASPAQAVVQPQVFKSCAASSDFCSVSVSSNPNGFVAGSAKFNTTSTAKTNYYAFLKTSTGATLCTGYMSLNSTVGCHTSYAGGITFEVAKSNATGSLTIAN